MKKIVYLALGIGLIAFGLLHSFAFIGLQLRFVYLCAIGLGVFLLVRRLWK
jgi:hypothetical protein